MTPRQRFTHDLSFLNTLRAEDEERLDSFFVPPPDFSLISGKGSAIVFGEPGSGKTTLYRMAQKLARGTGAAPENLIVLWRPAPIPWETAKNNASATRWLTFQMLDACGMALLKNISDRPPCFLQAPDWVQQRLVWFINKAIQGNLAIRMGPLMDDNQDSKHSILDDIQAMPVEEILYDPSPEQMIAELVSGLKKIGLDSIWVMADGLEGLAEADPVQLTQNLTSFLSALSLFEHSDMVFKFFIPSHIGHAVNQASGIVRRRVGSYHLKWDNNLLRQLVEKRLAAILNKDKFTMKELCESPAALFDSLVRGGGGVPREWLDQIQPLINYYIENNLTSPIKEKDWKTLRAEHPPYFWMDETGKKAKVGERVIPLNDVPPKAYTMLRHLYQHSGQVISKEELYYLVYLEMDHIPSRGDKEYEDPDTYRGLLDTNIYRLRQAIEPDPKEPILLRTVRGHGVILVSRL